MNANKINIRGGSIKVYKGKSRFLICVADKDGHSYKHRNSFTAEQANTTRDRILVSGKIDPTHWDALPPEFGTMAYQEWENAHNQGEGE